MQTFTDVINLIGVRAMADMLAVPESHVRTMKARDSIPPEYWPEIVAKAPRGLRSKVTFETLTSIRRSRFRGAA